MNENLLNINKTKYRYLMDNIEQKGTAIIYTIPVDKKSREINDELNRSYPSVKISYKTLIKMIDKTAKALVALGVKKDDIVVICSSSVPEMIYMDYALNKIGAIPSYIYPNVTSEEMNYYFNEVDAKYVYMLDTPEIRKNVIKALYGTKVEKIISSSVLESFATMFKLIAKRKKGNVVPQHCEKIISWADFIKQGKSIDKVTENKYSPNEICSLVHTSGTSSLPKAVMETNENINAVVKNYAIEKILITAGNIALNMIPYFIEFGKVLSHLVLSMGGAEIIIPEINYKGFPQMLKEFKPNIFEATPAHARELINSNIEVDLSNLKMACFGGDGFSTIEIKIKDFLKTHNSNADILNGYGCTEATSAAISNTITNYKFGSIGKPIGKVKAAIWDLNNSKTVHLSNVIGELIISGETVTNGYYADEKETEKVFIKHADGSIWVHTGDLAYFDDEGFFFLEGRIKNVIVRKAIKIAPKEIEDAILLCKNVKQCVVIGKYDREEGQVPSAHIVLNDNSHIEKSVDEIIELVNSKVQEFHRPAVYKIKPSIIITRNNKVNINALKIEDIATIPKDVNDAVISLSKDGKYDYELKIYCDKKINEQDTIRFIEQTAKNEKVLNGKIKYEFIVKKGKNYFRYV